MLILWGEVEGGLFRIEISVFLQSLAVSPSSTHILLNQTALSQIYGRINRAAAYK